MLLKENSPELFILKDHTKLAYFCFWPNIFSFFLTLFLVGNFSFLLVDFAFCMKSVVKKWELSFPLPLSNNPMFFFFQFLSNCVILFHVVYVGGQIINKLKLSQCLTWYKTANQNISVRKRNIKLAHIMMLDVYGCHY